MYTFYCNRSSVQFSPILSKSGLDQKSYSANKKGVKFFETQCICIYVHLYASIEMVFTVEMQSALTITISILLRICVSLDVVLSFNNLDT